MSVIGSEILAGASGQAAGYEIERSLRFNSADSVNLTQTFSSNGDRQKWTFSFWIKRSKLGTKQQIFGCQGTSDSDYAEMYFDTDDKLFIRFGYLSVVDAKPAAVFRDVGAWMHIVIALDTQNSTANDRLRVYVNGTELDDYSDDSRSSFTGTYGIGRAGAHKISGEPNGSGSEIDGYLAEIHYVNGSQLAGSDFAEYDDNNNWNPKEYSGSYGTNGFKLNFSDNTSTTTIAEDSSGNNNDWTANNFSVASGAGNDSLIDTPTNYTASPNNGGNYCTLNPLAKGAATSLSNGNLNYVGGAANQTLGTIGMSSGKWYWEDHKISGTYGATGIALADAPLDNHPGQGNSWAYNKNGNKWHNGSQSSYGATWDSGDTIGIAFDADAGTLVFYKNGVSQGTAFTGLTNGPYFVTGADNSVTGYFNFGASGSFEYTPPTGHKSLCTQNLPDPTIADGSTAMNVALYTGNGTSQSITGLGFSPDFVWVKNRAEAVSHFLFDTVRGNNNYLRSDGTFAEDSGSSNQLSFATDGFDVSGTGGGVNKNTISFVGWAWDGGTSTVSNTDGSITSSVRANASAGFSIVSYTGTGSAETIGHSLNDAPHLVIVKERDTPSSGVSGWMTYHKNVGDANKYLRLESAAAASTASAVFGSDPTASVFSIGNDREVSDNTKAFIAYCFAPVEGYSAFGSYTGNGSSSDGTFVNLGFRPKFLLVKGDATIDWIIEDSSRDTFNQMNKRLYPNDSVAESTSSNGNLDFLSNGFKPRTTHLSLNSSGTTYYYIAFAEHPFKTARAR